ncbi:MAG: helix-turn-helix domain-containing protein [Brucellaceae bacterium]|nr:helix-turn-helix domain-containing protein [Brucellaceae bacterium]
MNAIQCKMARTALKLGVRDLATLANVSQDTVSRFERGETLKSETVSLIQNTLENHGAIFIAENGEGPGVRLKKSLK